MGWSCRADAMNTLERISSACRRLTGTQNVWKYKGVKYMWEGSNTEHKDGSITGGIYQYRGAGVVKAGSFKIAGNGVVERGGHGFALLAGSTASKPAAKKERFTLQRYRYNGFNKSTGRPGEIIYVDLANKHPDPMKKLLWGYDSHGNSVHGDYVGYFDKVGASQVFEYEQTGKYAADEKRVRHAAIIRAIKKGW